MALRFCAVQFRGCGYIWDDSNFLALDGREHVAAIAVCPACQRDCHFELTEENVSYLADPSTIDKARAALAAHLQKNAAAAAATETVSASTTLSAPPTRARTRVAAERRGRTSRADASLRPR